MLPIGEGSGKHFRHLDPLHRNVPVATGTAGSDSQREDKRLGQRNAAKPSFSVALPIVH